MTPFDQFLDACQTGNLRLVTTRLRREPILLNKKSDDGWTPLLCASLNGHRAVVRHLLKKGAAIDLANNKGATALSDVLMF